MTLREYRNALLKQSNGFATDYIVVANTYMNLSFKRLTEKLSLLNAMVNKKLLDTSKSIQKREYNLLIIINKVGTILTHTLL